MRGLRVINSTLCLMAICAVGLTACSDDEASIARRTCQRLDECHGFPRTETVDSCTQGIEGSLDQFDGDARERLEKYLSDCLKEEACPMAINCFGFGYSEPDAGSPDAQEVE